MKTTPKSRKTKHVTYDQFMSMDRADFYLLPDEALNHLDMAPRIRTIFLEALLERPYSESELMAFLHKKSPTLRVVWQYIFENSADPECDSYAECKRVLKETTAGIEVRISRGTPFYGLSTRLDSV